MPGQGGAVFDRRRDARAPAESREQGQLHRLLESPDPGSPPAAQEDSGDPSGGVLGSGILRLRRGSPGPARYLYFCRPCGVGSDTRRCPICGERGELARCDEREP